MSVNTGNPGIEDGEELAVSGGTFTQEQVNAIVQDRLARQKARLLAGYEEKISRLSVVEGELEKVRAKAEKYDASLTQGLAERKKALPAGVLKLLEGLDPTDQAAWLDENADTLTKPVSPHPGPVTPRPEGNEVSPGDLVAQKRASGTYSI